MTGNDGLASIETLRQEAARLSQHGQTQAAAGCYQQILEHHPADAQALQYIIRHWLNCGQTRRCRQLLEASMAAAPEASSPHLQMATVHASSGDTQAAMDSLQQAIQRGDDGMAALYKGQLALLAGDEDAALEVWSEAWKSSPMLQRWQASPATAKPVMRLLEQSASFIVNQRKRQISAALDSIDQQYGSDSSKGIREALATVLDKAKPGYADPRQRPGFLYYPGLETQPFFPARRFAWVDAVEAASTDIMQELKMVMTQQQNDLHAYVQVPAGKDPAQWQALNQSLQWSAYHLIRDGEPLPEHTGHCPATMAAMQSVPLVDIPRHAPEVFFSVLQPDTHIPPHYGLSNYKLAVHLPLIIPADCAIRVGTQRHDWQPGKVVVFDDSFEHEAWNRSGQLRVVLIFEIWHPQLTEGERAAIRRGIGTLLQFNQRYGTRLPMHGQ